jgi:Fe-S-cluster-containing dehydrogenase component
MAIDLNSCTGCSACMVACQSENNIHVVGKKYVMQGREMHWIRIDRYYAGTAENPEALFQPITCQHCDNAPCETVCPVAATVHNSEGLNDMVYNRCVGTRYCSNNCPYKVRRFNWFNYAKLIEKPMHMALNPEVTVRPRGVMEKCTFCVQRIKAGKNQAKTENRPLKDGDIKVACEVACPTSAIVFGDLNNETSRVAKVFKSEPRAYALLEEWYAKPSIRYMSKIRNNDFITPKEHDPAAPTHNSQAPGNGGHI